MNDNDTIRAKRDPDGTIVQVVPDGTTRALEDRTDWARLAAMTEEEIEANALADVDNPPLTAEALARLRPVPNPREIRRRLNMTQEQFAARFDMARGTLQDWEQGVRTPDRTARTLLRLIDNSPEAVIQAIEGPARQPPARECRISGPIRARLGGARHAAPRRGGSHAR